MSSARFPSASRRRDAVGWTAKLLLLSLLLVVGVVATVVPGQPAAHAQPSDPLTVTIDSVSPAVIDVTNPDQEITLSGTIHNASDQDLYYVVGHFWRYREPITTADALADARASEPTNPIGRRLIHEHRGHLSILTREKPFAPGQTAPFHVKATVRELEFTRDDAVYLMGVQVRSGDQTMGRARVLGVATHRKLPRSVVVPLTHRPTRLGPSSFVDDSLAKDLASTILPMTTKAQQLGAIVALDPMLLSDVHALTTTYTAGGQRQSPVPQAEKWLSIIDDLMVANRIVRLPTASMALTRIPSDQLEHYLSWEYKLVDSWLHSRPTLYDARDAGSPELIGQLAKHGVDVVLSSNLGSGTVEKTTVLQTTPWDLAGPRPGDTHTAAQTQSARLAQELLAPTPPVYVLDTTEKLEAASQTESLHDARRLPESPASAPTVITPPTSPEPWHDVAKRLDETQQKLSFFKDLTGTSAGRQVESQLIGAWSDSWRSPQEALEWLGKGQGLNVDSWDVKIRAAKDFVMGSGSSRFPITVTNGTSTTVKARVVFESAAPHRLSVPPTSFITLEAGEKQTLNVLPEARSNGVVRVTARLETQAGKRFGEPVDIQITATSYGRAGWIIIIISGAVVLGGTALRIKKVRAKRAEETRE